MPGLRPRLRRSRLARAGLFAFALLALGAANAAAAPIRISGRIVAPARALSGMRVELLSDLESHGERLARLAGGAPPALAVARPGTDGRFELLAPEPGCYRVALRAKGFLPLAASLSLLVEDRDLPPLVPLPAKEFEVRVVGPGGQPASGVEIVADTAAGSELRVVSGPGDWGIAERRSRSDANGVARLPLAAGETLTLSALAPDLFLPLALDEVSGKSVTLRLPAAKPRELQILGPDGRPLAGAILAFGDWPLRATGGDGRLAIDLPTLSLPYQVEGPGGEWATTGPPADRGRPWTARLAPPRFATGRVLDAPTGAPLPGALVVVFGLAAARTAGDGGFRLPLGADPKVYLQAGAAEHRAWEQEVVAASGPLTIRLAPAARLAGWSVDEAGSPVEEVRIQARPVETGLEPEPLRVAWSREGGRFALPNLRAGGLYELVATREGFATLKATVHAAGASEGAPPLRLVLLRGRRVTGRVVDEAGGPVAAATVRLRQPSSALEPPAGRRATSDEDGRFEFRDLGSELFSLDVAHPGFAPLALAGVEIPADAAVVDLGALTLATGAVVEGRVTDGNGKPVAEAQVMEDLPFRYEVELEQHQTVTDGQGRFRLDDLRRGDRVDLSVRHPDYAPAEVPDVTAPTVEPLRIELQAAGSLAGRVVDADGMPVQGAQLMAETATGSGGMSSFGIGETDARGEFRCSGLAPGTIDLAATAPGFRPGRLQALKVPSGGTLGGLEIVLARGAEIAGRVFDSAGRPAAGAQVSLWSQDSDAYDPFQNSATTDGDGGYRLGGLGGGRFLVSASGEGGERAHVTLDVAPGTNRLDLRFRRGQEVAGRVVDEDGEPVVGAMVGIDDGSPYGLSAPTESSGEFRFPSVPDGRYRLLAHAEGFGDLPSSLDLTVAGEPVRGLEVRLGRRTSAAITGRLLGLEPDEIGLVRVRAISGTGLPREALVEGDRYRFAGIGAGEWRVDGTAPDRHAGGTVRVEPGSSEAVLDLDFASGFTLSGRVTVEGRPLAGAPVSTSSGAGTRTRHDGSFILPNLPPGSYEVTVLGPDGIGTSRTVELTADRTLEIDLVPVE